MCGIVGYTGVRQALPLLLSALERLEYRGYDSAGVAIIGPRGDLEIRKSAGKIERLVSLLAGEQIEGSTGIGHTRWATHGRPSDENAHPHTDCSGRVCVAHNGVIENCRELRSELEAGGHVFRSETDTEVLAHLVEGELQSGSLDGAHSVWELTELSAEGVVRRAECACPASSLVAAVSRALKRVRGLYAVAVLCLDQPEVIVGARNRAPLIVGLGRDGNLIASDIPAVLESTRHVMRLNEGDLVALTPRGVAVIDCLGRATTRDVEETTLDHTTAQKSGFPHFFLKEVHEQGEALERTLAGRLQDGAVQLPELASIDLRRVRRVILTGCGSAHHACMTARYAFERWLRLPVDVDIASELRYRDAVLDDSVLCIAVSQSGETADTLAAFELAGALGAQRVAVTNVVGSAITFVADAVVYQHSGPEVAVVASKTYTGQLAALYLLGLALAPSLGRLSADTLRELTTALQRLPFLVERALVTSADASRIAQRHANVKRLLFLGRGVGYPTALEGALKLKEISYLHAEGYAAGELKHGPLALVEPGSVVVALATPSATLDKLISNIEEVRARGGHIVAIAAEDDDQVAPHADEVIRVPEAPEILSPIINVVPLQTFAYYVAVARGCDVDKPRNLAKSVTVE